MNLVDAAFAGIPTGNQLFRITEERSHLHPEEIGSSVSYTEATKGVDIVFRQIQELSQEALNQ